jgi:hypothetical protein
MDTKKKVFMEYRRGVFPDTGMNCFEGFPQALRFLLFQCGKYGKETVGKAEWEAITIDDSRTFKIYLN